MTRFGICSQSWIPDSDGNLVTVHGQARGTDPFSRAIDNSEGTAPIGAGDFFA